jgi:hypothetical protein
MEGQLPGGFNLGQYVGQAKSNRLVFNNRC